MKLLVVAISLFALNANATLPRSADPENSKVAGSSYCPHRMEQELEKVSQKGERATPSRTRAVR